MNVFDFINNYAKAHNIKNYAIKSRVLTKDDFSQKFSFAPGIAFFYKEIASGIIQNIANLTESFFTVSTPTEFFDFTKIAKIEDNGSIQHAESDFIFVADNTMTINCVEGANALFSQIYSAQLYYFYLTVLPESDDSSKVNIDLFNI
jgi:hypothetical protein